MKKKIKEIIDEISNRVIPSLIMCFMAFANGLLFFLSSVIFYKTYFNKLAFIVLMITLLNIMYYIIFYVKILDYKK